MDTKIKSLLKCLAVALSILSYSLHAETIISETFNSSDGAVLTGRAPTFIGDSLPSLTWQGPSPGSAPFAFEANVDIASNNNTTWIDIGSFINNAKGQADGIFSVSASFSGAPTSGSWFSLGFYTEPSAVSAGNANLEAGILFRNNGDLEGWSAQEGGIVAADFTSGIDTDTIHVELDLSTWDNSTDFGTITFSAQGASATHNLTSDFDWGAVGFVTSKNVLGSIENFEFSQIPEPSTYGIMVLASSLLFVIRRRRSKS